MTPVILQSFAEPPVIPEWVIPVVGIAIIAAIAFLAVNRFRRWQPECGPGCICGGEGSIRATQNTSVVVNTLQPQRQMIDPQMMAYFQQMAAYMQSQQATNAQIMEHLQQAAAQQAMSQQAMVYLLKEIMASLPKAQAAPHVQYLPAPQGYMQAPPQHGYMPAPQRQRYLQAQQPTYPQAYQQAYPPVEQFTYYTQDGQEIIDYQPDVQYLPPPQTRLLQAPQATNEARRAYERGKRR